MPNELSTTSFDYGELDGSTKGKLINLEGSIHRHISAVRGSMLAIGEDLAAAQEVLADYSGGTFVRWVETNFPLSKSTAYNMIAAYRVFGSFPTVGKLEDTAMYLLASPETPKLALNAAKKMAEKGHLVTAKVASDLIEKYTKSEQESEPEPEPEEAPTDERYEESDPADDTETRTESVGGDSSDEDLENCTHVWVSDWDGVRYCERCKMDYRDDSPPQPYDAAKHLNGIAATIVQCRLKVDEVVRNSEKHRLTDQIQADLDKALISLRKWAGSVK